MTEVASMPPVDPLETALAVQFVAANAVATDIMAVTTDLPVDVMKRWAASGAMLRQSRGALSSPRRGQAKRMKQARSIQAAARLFDIGEVRPTRTNAAAENVSPVEPVPVTEMAFHKHGNETPTIHDTSDPVTPIAEDRPDRAPFVPDPQIIARLVDDDRAQRQARPVRPVSGSHHAKSFTRFVPSYETVSSGTGYETPVRLDRSGSAGSDGSLPSSSVSENETRFQITGNETMVGFGGSVQAVTILADQLRVVAHNESS